MCSLSTNVALQNTAFFRKFFKKRLKNDAFDPCEALRKHEIRLEVAEFTASLISLLLQAFP